MPNPPTTVAAPETLYLVATSGHPNFGDELITASWLRFLARTRPDAEVILDCPQPGLAAFLFDGLHPRLKITDLLFRVVWETREMAPEQADAHIDRLLLDLGSPRYDYGLLAMRRASTVHFLGGGHINALWPFHLGLLRAGLRLGETSGARVVATGLGLTPAHDPARLREYLGGFTHASVRDDPSAALSATAAVADDALLDLALMPGFQERPAAPGTAEPGEVWVCLQSDLSAPETLDAVVAAVRELLTSERFAGRTLRYAEAIPGVDRIAYDRLADLIPEEGFLPFVRLWREGFPGRPGQTWLTTRFHFHLLAAACGAEGTAFEISEDYYRDKHESLVDAGTGWSVTPVGATTATAPALSPDFRLLAARLHSAKRTEAETLYPVPARRP